MMIDYITTIIEACLALFHHSHASEKGKGDAVGTTTDRDGICLHSRSRTKDMNLYLACKQAY